MTQVQIIQEPEVFAEKLVESIRVVLLPELKKQLRSESGKPEEFLSKEELAKYFKVHPNTIDNWVSQGYITKYGVCGRKVVFKRSEIEECVIPLK